MIRSPPFLRSRKDKDAATDKRDQRSLSTSSDPGSTMTSTNEASSAEQLSLADNVNVLNIVDKHLSRSDIFEKLVKKMSDEIKSAVSEAVCTAMIAANEEIARLNKELTSLRGIVTEMSSKLEDRADDLEQYQRRNNLRIYGVPETDGEDTDQLVVRMCQEKLGLKLTESSLCRSHRVGRQPAPDKDGRKRHRAIIVRFISYRDRRLVFGAKKKLKGCGVTVKEDLTAQRQKVFQEAVARHGLKHTWTSDGRVLWTDADGKRGMATRLADLKNGVSP